MKFRMRVVYDCVMLLIAASVFGTAVHSRGVHGKRINAANSPMGRLARAFCGKWKTHEEFAKNEFYPNGAQRDGTAEFVLATGGTSLIETVHSDRSAGILDFVVVFWWDATENNYKMFTCGNNGVNPCRMRGSAHWDDDRFVNEFEMTIRGENHAARDSFEHISPKSMTLVACVALASDGMKPIITTTYVRE